MTLSRTRRRWRPSGYLLDELLHHDAGAGMDLEDIDLSGLDVARINLTGATMDGASLSGASLRRAVLDRACFRDVDLGGADLTGASLRGTWFVDTDLRQATLTDVDCWGSISARTRDRVWLVGGLVGAESDPPRTRTRSTPWG